MNRNKGQLRSIATVYVTFEHVRAGLSLFFDHKSSSDEPLNAVQSEHAYFVFISILPYRVVIAALFLDSC